MKQLAIGAASALIITGLLYVVAGHDAARQIESILSGAALIALIILSGTLNDSVRTRMNFDNERSEERKVRERVITKLVLFGIPHVLVTFLLYL